MCQRTNPDPKEDHPTPHLDVAQSMCPQVAIPLSTSGMSSSPPVLPIPAPTDTHRPGEPTSASGKLTLISSDGNPSQTENISVDPPNNMFAPPPLSLDSSDGNPKQIEITALAPLNLTPEPPQQSLSELMARSSHDPNAPKTNTSSIPPPDSKGNEEKDTRKSIISKSGRFLLVNVFLC